MDYTNFFSTPIVLEDDLVRIEPLEEKHFKLLLPVAMQKEAICLAAVTQDVTRQFFLHVDHNGALFCDPTTAKPVAHVDAQDIAVVT